MKKSESRSGLLTIAGAAALFILASAQPSPAVNATGGDAVYEIAGYRTHVFTDSATAGSLTVTSGGDVELLLVAGGGGGGATIAGGGGAGGLVYSNSVSLPAGTYPVVAGAGGAGATAASWGRGANGGNSSFGSLVAHGGGGGGGWNDRWGVVGGSGGGGCCGNPGGAASHAGEGNAGGSSGSEAPGGGGGAGTAGTDGSGAQSGNGGAGLEYPDFAFAGSPPGWFAGGGGGGAGNSATAAGAGGAGGGGAGSAQNSGLPGSSGVAGTGGGGGGGSYHPGTGGGNGGSGIVLVRYPVPAAVPVVANLGATLVGSRRASLNGQVTDQGGDMPAIWFHYWIDGQATTSTVAMGAQNGVFTKELTGLLTGSNYTYRILASNVTGTAWSGDKSFTTPTNEFFWTGLGSDNNASTPANWSLNAAPTHSTDLVRLDETSGKDMTWDLDNSVASWSQTADYNGTVTIGTTYGGSFTRLHITGDCQILGGTWTHPANADAETYRLHASVGGNLTVGPGASIDATGKGYAKGQGPGRGNGQNHNNHGGASHGGLAGYPDYEPSFLPYYTTYGSITSPTNLGSGGFGHGGGAIRIDVDGTTTLQGSLLAKGENDGSGAAGNAGGSIYLTTASLDGAGLMDASANDSGQCGAGGGRIAVILTEGSDFGAISMRTCGSGGVFWNVPGYSAAGTIYKETSSQAGGHGTLVIDNNGISTLATTLMPPTESDLDAFASIVIKNRGILGLNTNTHLNLGSGASLVTYGPEQSFIAALSTNYLRLPSTWTLTGYTFQCYTNLGFDGNLAVSNGTIEMATWAPENLHVAGNLLVGTGGNVSHAINFFTEAHRLSLRVDGDLTIADGGTVDATGKGYWNSQGPGRGNGGGDHGWHGGASHGGLSAYPDGGPDYPYYVTYGSIVAPTNLGSGGLLHGGGSIEIGVGGATTLNGSILAKGVSDWGAGASGGSIYLTSGSISGAGVMDASAASGGCGGGGGRISVILDSGSTFGTITMQAFGGTGAGPNHGAAGTVYTKTAAQGNGYGVLTINGNLAPYATNTVTTIPGSANAAKTEVSSLNDVTLVATNYANVELLGNLTMGDLFLTGDNARLYLKGHTLKLRAPYHADWGTEDRVVHDGGQIVWSRPGTVFLLR